MKQFELKQIGVIHTPHIKSAGTPIQPVLAEGFEGTVEVLPQYADGLKDLEGFERIWLVFWCDRAGPVSMTVRPFLDNVERGLFATRAPSRPNPIGISAVRLLAVEGNMLRVADVDILDGTPLLDIKPYASRFDNFDVTRSGWLDNTASGRDVADDRFENGKKTE